MNKTAARKVIARVFADATTKLEKGTRKEINPALFALGLPTLGAHKTMWAYASALSVADSRTFGVAVGLVPTPAPKKAARWTCSCETLRDHLSVRCSAKAA